MFIDVAMNFTTRAPAERNVSGAEYVSAATFRSYGAKGTLWSLHSISITSLRDGGADSKRPCQKKQLTVCA
jgi:hypothetical protein